MSNLWHFGKSNYLGYPNCLWGEELSNKLEKKYKPYSFENPSLYEIFDSISKDLFKFKEEDILLIHWPSQRNLEFVIQKNSKPKIVGNHDTIPQGYFNYKRDSQKYFLQESYIKYQPIFSLCDSLYNCGIQPYFLYSEPKNLFFPKRYHLWYKLEEEYPTFYDYLIQNLFINLYTHEIQHDSIPSIVDILYDTISYYRHSTDESIDNSIHKTNRVKKV
jgi:hypothetical protein